MKQDSYKIDHRTKQDILKQVQTLAANYTPEWNFDVEDPDIGSVLALLFTEQFYGNVNRFNEVLKRYHTEFVNLLDISLKPAHPACAIVLMNLLSDTIPGAYIPKRTRLLAENEDEVIVFETAHPVFLTSSQLRAAFMTSMKSGKVLPVYGDFPLKDFVGNGNLPVMEEDEYATLLPFGLFDFREKGIERQAMVLYHNRIFDVENETIYCKVQGNDDFLTKLIRGEYRFLYYTEDGFCPIESCQVIGDKIVLIKEKPNKKVTERGCEYSVMVIEAVKPQMKTQMFQNIMFSSAGAVRNVEYVGNGSNDYPVEKFSVFGDTLSLFSECYIGMDNYFSQKGATVSLNFKMDFDEHYVGYAKEAESTELKIVKRKPRVVMETMVSYAHAEEVSIEYNNGIGWKRLECDKEYRKIFADAKGGDVQITFVCPDDWSPIQVGGYYGRVLRFQLQRSDNCYLQPCIHRYPIISNLVTSYSYEDKYEIPELGKVYYGTAEADITGKLLEQKPFVGFEKGNYQDTALYLGFDKVFENGPVSLWWKLADTARNLNRKLHFFYSTATGFKEMKVVDYTQGLSKTGEIMFMPPSDMTLYELEEKKLCWIKIVQEDLENSKSPVIIEQLSLNAVEAFNIITHDVEEFYLDEVTAGMSFPLQAEDILDAEVWVNEKDELSEESMREMLHEQPDRVKANLNYLGLIEEFFVKWEERDNFNNSSENDRHYVLDRMTNRIIFGDGIHVKIPQNTENVAFTVQVRCCNGQRGNVKAGMIQSSDTNLMFVGEITNPFPAYGGSNMETLERALARGANLISSGGRFVTEADYKNEILSFSDNIDKVSVSVGMDRDGELNEQVIYIILLMKDFAEGSVSFYRMQSELREHLLQHCELSISPEEISIEEPVFVELSVDVWVEAINIEDSFEIQNLVREALEKYLNPVAGENHRGWEIGVLPRKSQIMMRLNALKSKGIIRQIMVTAKYVDQNGVHEMDLDSLKAKPSMVVCSGVHKVHITKPR